MICEFLKSHLERSAVGSKKPIRGWSYFRVTKLKYYLECS